MATTASVMFEATVFYSDTSFRIEVTDSSGKVRKLWIDLRRYDVLSAKQTTDEERTVFCSLMDGPISRPHRISVSRDDLVILKGIKDKTEQPVPAAVPPTNGHVPVKPEDPPAVPLPAKERGVVVHPVKEEPRSNGVLKDSMYRDAAHVAGRIAGRELSKVAGSTKADERKLIGMERTVETLRGNLYQIVYDLRRGKEEQRKVPDPCYYLWGYGFPYTESVWIFTEEQIKHRNMVNVLERWSEHPDVIEFHITPVHPGAIETMREIARNRLCKMLVEVHMSLVGGIDPDTGKRIKGKIPAADERLAEALKEFEERVAKKGTVSWKERTMVQAKRDNAVRSSLRDAAEDLRNAAKLAEQYDDQGQTGDLLAALRQAILAEQKAFNAHAAAVRVTGVNVRI